MKLTFFKMHGLGNDFMLLDLRQKRFAPAPEDIRAWSHRQMGVGFDQLLLVEVGDAAHDFTYRIFNADGSEVGHCGNGARCFAHYLYLNQLHDFQARPVRVKIKQGSLEISREEALYRVNMGQPRFLSAFETAGKRFLGVDVGNPHAVTVVDDVESTPVDEIAPLVQAHQALFPESVNVGFMQILDKNHILLRVYERGVGETLACGTGACAAVAAGIHQGLLANKVRVQFAAGGVLHMDWTPPEALYMLGAATLVYRGEIDVDG